MTCNDEERIKNMDDLPLQESAGLVKAKRGVAVLLQNRCLASDVRKDDEVTAIPKRWIKSGVLIQLKFKNGIPKKGFQTIEVDL